MEYLLKLMRLRQQNESAKSVLSEIQGMFAEDKGWASEDEMLKDLAGFRRERVAQCAYWLTIFHHADMILSGDKDFIEADIERPLVFSPSMLYDYLISQQR